MIEDSLKRMFGLQERVVVLTGAAGGLAVRLPVAWPPSAR